MLLLAGALPKDEFDVRFLLLSDRGEWADKAEAAGISVQILGLSRAACAPLRPRCMAAGMRALRRYVANTRHVDIVDAWLVPSYTFAAMAQPFARVPVLVAGRRSTTDLYASKSWVRRAAAATATRWMDAIVANSRAAAVEAVDLEHVDPGRVHVIRNAVLPAESDPAARVEQRRRWGFGPGELVVGCVANLKAGKGLDDLVEAAVRLRVEAPHLRFVLVGEGPLRDALADRVATAGLGGVVLLQGAVADARPLYGAFDLVVQTSHSEGLPNAVLEAAAAGRPIIATAVGGTIDIVTNDADGLLVPPGEPAALVAAIRCLVADPKLRERLGRAAASRAATFSVEHLVADTAALYRRLLADPALPQALSIGASDPPLGLRPRGPDTLI